MRLTITSLNTSSAAEAMMTERSLLGLLMVAFLIKASEQMKRISDTKRSKRITLRQFKSASSRRVFLQTSLLKKFSPAGLLKRCKTRGRWKKREARSTSLCELWLGRGDA